MRFIGHVATSDGLGIDPTKVKAIIDMPDPTDLAGVQRLLGLAQYLAKFLPHLSDITKPLRNLTRSDTDWMWESSQQNASRHAEESCRKYTGLDILQSCRRGNNSVRCVTSRTRCSTDAEWTTCGLCITCPHISGNWLRSNRKKPLGDCFRLRQI